MLWRILNFNSMPKKKLSKKRPSPAKKQVHTPSSKPRKLAQPRKELTGIQKEIRQVRNPLYKLNSKIKNAPNRYQAGKLKKERTAYLQQIEGRLTGLVEKRSELRAQIKEFDKLKRERVALKRQVRNLEKKIRVAADDQNLPVAEALRYDLLKKLGQIDELDKKMGASIKKVDLTKFDREKEDDQGGKNFELDHRSPYAIWEAIKQLHIDLEEANFKFFIVNGKQFPSESVIQISAEASAFWVASKRKADGTPYINRFINFKTNTVKYLYYNS